ncbi:MAG TPA: amino acid adenylation domain-containing protein, partial [Polyangiaceae bacterium]|nr:amino acid adenylation domain-containing protein [Polyangiaceae bacterium]
MKTVHCLFSEQAIRTPQAEAVTAGDARISYADLDRQSNEIAARLRGAGVGYEVVVGLCAERSIDLIAALLGILKAGGAYLYLDPQFPRERLAFMCEDARASVVLVSAGGARALDGLEVRCVPIAGEYAPLPHNVQDSRQPPPPSGEGWGGGELSAMAYVVYTSGSTGRPKGVAIEHHSLSHVARALVDAYDVRPGDRVLQFASPSWDTMVEEIFPTLLVGATLVLRSNDMIETTALVRGCSAHGVTIANLPTAIWHRLVADLEDGLTVPKTLRTMIIGGEPAAPERIETWFARAGARIRLVNTYGLTEAAAVCTLAELSHVESPVPIGAPLPRVGVSIRNEQLEVVGDGVHGEICISGEGVARGYLNRPEATALKFAPDGSGNRIYRSGDSGFRRSDGQFVCLGRLDDQIKVGGVRVEPGEIAAVLRRHYAVAEAVVLAHDADGDRRLVAYVVLHTSAILPAAHLRAFARDHLPAVMVPEIVLLDALPLTASGKIDRQKLLPKGPAVSDVGRAPASGVVGSEPLEAALCALAREVTGAASLGPDDDFFDAGGDSLVATRLIVRARRELGLEVSFERILTGRTMRAVAANGRTGARETPSLELHRRDPSDRGETPSLGQEWYWRVQQSEPETTAHNLTWIVHVRGELDPELVERVLGELVQRHETLRTILAEDDTGLHAIALPHPRIWLRRLDWTEDARTAAHVTAFAERETETPFDLATELPFRATAIKRDESLYALVFCIHHIAIDGWSLGIVAREAEAVYGALRRGEKASLPPLPIAYSDYVAWERALLASEAAEKQLAYWRRQLRGAPSSLALPFDRPRAEHHAARGARI